METLQNEKYLCKKTSGIFLDEEERSIQEEPEQGENKIVGDGNNTPPQRKLGLDIGMIGAREETLGRTRSQTQEMSSPRNESKERADLTMEDWIQETCLILVVTSGPTEPETFQEEWYCQKEKERNNWRTAIRKEMRSLIDREVSRKTERKKITNNRRLIGNKWVFKIKKDTCMIFKQNELGICIITMYVDDMLIIGEKEQMQEFTTQIQKEFSVKIQHNLADYLGCEFHMNKVKTRGWLGQPSIIKSLEQKFGERAMKERLSLTPGTPRFTARRLENPEDKVSPEEHETYRSGVGTLLYLTKHSRPDICNPVRELTKTMDAPAPVHLKESTK